MKTTSVTLKAAVLAALLAMSLPSAVSAQRVGANDNGQAITMSRQPFLSGRFGQESTPPTRPDVVKKSSDADHGGIVGFWHVKFISRNSPGIPNGAVIDSGFSQWHSDGTEIMNSSRRPVTQSFCLGVWKKTGPSAYKLNHFAISWNPDGSLLGPANLREQIRVSHNGESFSGTFTIDQYNSSGKLQTHIAGNIEGKRITIDTKASGVF